MPTLSLVRLGGLASMVGGGVAATLGLLLFLPVAVFSERYPIGPYVVLQLGAMATIAAVHALQRQQRELYGLLGALASFTAFVGVALSLTSGFLVGPHGTQGLWVGTVGLVASGLVTLGVGVLPAWCALLLIAGNPYIAVFLPPLAGVAWALVGYAVFQAAHWHERPSRVR